MAARFLASSNILSSLPSKSSPSGIDSSPARCLRLPRIALALVASAVVLSACADGPDHPPYPGRRTTSMQDNTAMGSTAREMRSTQSVLSSGNSMLGTIGSIGRNIERLGR
jgi:hypothetical protein